VSGGQGDWSHVRTERLWLDQPVQDDLADLHRIHADPASWSGPDVGNDDPDAIRLVYLDREPDAAIRAAMDERFTPGPTV